MFVNVGIVALAEEALSPGVGEDGSGTGRRQGHRPRREYGAPRPQNRLRWNMRVRCPGNVTARATANGG